MAREILVLKKRIGNKLRIRRRQLGLSQEHVAFQAEISPTYLSQLEAGARNPSLEVLLQLASALRVELYELLKP